jgi:hypothetical protein
MQDAGTPSWRWGESGSQLAHVALYLRDSYGLAVPAHLDVPPPLTPAVAPAPAALSERDRDAAGQQWTSWWDEIIDLDVRRREIEVPGNDARARVRALLAERERVADPPDFEALANRPELRRLVAASYEEACRWDGPPRRRRSDPATERGAHFEWDLIRQVAEDVAFDRQVSIDAIDGRALILSVEGLWWTRAAPGAVLCSAAVTTDPVLAQVVLRDAFLSALG